MFSFLFYHKQKIKEITNVKIFGKIIKKRLQKSEFCPQLFTETGESKSKKTQLAFEWAESYDSYSRMKSMDIRKKEERIK